MARSFNTLPTSIFPRNNSLYYTVKQGKKEYSFGKTKACGPGGLNCACCNPHMGNIRNGKDKPKMRRYVRRVSKMNMVKEIAAEMEAIRQEFEESREDMNNEFFGWDDDYDDYDPWYMYCYQMAEDDYDYSFYEGY